MYVSAIYFPGFLASSQSLMFGRMHAQTELLYFTSVR